MNPSAVEQAKLRLIKAQKALAAFRASTTFQEAEEAWTDFLVAASAIYSKLEQGVKGHSKSEPWYGRKKNERKKDRLLKYLHHARNSNEHGIERVVGTTPPNFDLLGRPLKFNERHSLMIDILDGVTKLPIGGKREAVLAGPTLKPIRAYDRKYGDYFDPPKTHLGKEIKCPDFVDSLGEVA
ncbi:MAG: hypothetical protein WCD20_13485, partial [Rhodomicrobium sp.]